MPSNPKTNDFSANVLCDNRFTEFVFLNVTNLPRVMNASSPKIRTAGGAPWKIGIKNLSLSVFISIFPIISIYSSIGGGSSDDLPSISGQID